MSHASVIVLHGILRTNRSMSGLAKFLESANYRVLNLDYPSSRQDLSQIADHIHPQIEAFLQGQSGPVHFVGYSMGGLVIRTYLNRYRPANLGRVVMIGTPNAGSEVADFLKNFIIYRKFYGPAGQQLVTAQDEFKHLFGQVDYELGIIAGNRPIDLISSRIIGKENDGKVSLESALHPDATCHVILPANHTFFPSNKAMWKQAASFLKSGQFA